VVQVAEPDEKKAILMMRGVASVLEKHHKVQILDEALEAAVKLSHRYIPARQLPDKAVSLLDTACARVAVSQHATPAEVDDSRKRIEALQTELEIIGREKAIGIDRQPSARRCGRGAAGRGALAAGGPEGSSALEGREGAGRRTAGLRAKRAAAASRSKARAAAPRSRGGEAAEVAAGSAPPEAAGRDDGARAALGRCRPSWPSCRASTPLILPTVDYQAVAAWSPTGPASRSAAWRATRSRPCCDWPRPWASASSARTTRWR
jgi:type VI secretion system protein VasG